MNFLSTLGKIATSWYDLFQPGEALADWGWVKDLMGVLSTVLWVILALVGAAGGIYAVYVGIKMARADSAEAREENKKRLVNIIISIVVVIVLIIFFNTFLPMIIGAFYKGDNKWEIPGQDGTGDTAVRAAVDNVKLLLRLY